MESLSQFVPFFNRGELLRRFPPEPFKSAWGWGRGTLLKKGPPGPPPKTFGAGGVLGETAGAGRAAGRGARGNRLPLAFPPGGRFKRQILSAAKKAGRRKTTPLWGRPRRPCLRARGEAARFFARPAFPPRPPSAIPSGRRVVYGWSDSVIHRTPSSGGSSPRS